jgi:hypothetical protein
LRGLAVPPAATGAAALQILVRDPWLTIWGKLIISLFLA